jgi:formylglycine-generating enzyme required for sulfatase activity
MKFRRIPGGSFRMGSPSWEEGRDDDERQHTVQVGEFWLGETEVTQAQWKAIMNNNPSEFKGDDLPVEQMQFNDVQQFIKRLNARTGKRFRLPTEAEWEYACREGGRKVRYCNGKDEASKSEIHYGGFKTKPVASFSPNSLGLYDMSGNVYEWTCSEYKKRYDGSEEKCIVSASRHSSLRGGSWGGIPRRVRAANRYVNDFLDAHYNYIGFRLARD